MLDKTVMLNAIIIELCYRVRNRGLVNTQVLTLSVMLSSGRALYQEIWEPIMEVVWSLSMVLLALFGNCGKALVSSQVSEHFIFILNKFAKSYIAVYIKVAMSFITELFTYTTLHL